MFGGLFWKVIVILFLWFCVLQPLIFGTYNQVQATYWWMRP